MDEMTVRRGPAKRPSPFHEATEEKNRLSAANLENQARHAGEGIGEGLYPRARAAGLAEDAG